MADRVWIEMPVVGNGTPDGRVQPKYPVETNATIVHKHGKVYIDFEDGSAQEEALRQPDCRRLTSTEGRELEETLPFPIASPAPRPSKEKGPLTLGYVVAWVTGKLGIEKCPGCQQRRHKLLNRVVVWGWWRKARFQSLPIKLSALRVHHPK